MPRASSMAGSIPSHRVEGSGAWVPELATVLLGLFLLAGCDGNGASASAPPSPRGDVLFDGFCSVCHGRDGAGVERAAPSLVGSPKVAGDPEAIIGLVIRGTAGPREPGGSSFAAPMPAFASLLDDEEVAAVVSFVRKRFGERGGPVTAGTVRHVRSGQ